MMEIDWLVDIFVYDKNGLFLPNFQQLHGSASFELDASNRNDYFQNEFSLFRQEMDITRTKWKALDKKSERCSKDRMYDTEKCITR